MLEHLMQYRIVRMAPPPPPVGAALCVRFWRPALSARRSARPSCRLPTRSPPFSSSFVLWWPAPLDSCHYRERLDNANSPLRVRLRATATATAPHTPSRCFRCPATTPRRGESTTTTKPIHPSPVPAR